VAIPIKLAKTPQITSDTPKLINIKLNKALIQHQQEIRIIKQNVARKSRSKGKNLEYEISEMQCKWYNIPQTFSRSKGGGVRKIGQPGDITTPDGFILCEEAKNDERWNFSSFLSPNGSRGALQFIWQAWEQTVDQCNIYNTRKHERQVFKYPVLIFTKNYENIFIMFRINEFNCNLPDCTITLVQPQYGTFIICDFQEFLNVNDPQNFIRR